MYEIYSPWRGSYEILLHITSSLYGLVQLPVITSFKQYLEETHATVTLKKK